jgi:hypothetical protein
MQNYDEMLKRMRSIDRTIWRNRRVPPLLQLVVAIMIILIIISYVNRARAADGWQQCMQAAYALSASTGDRKWLRVDLFCRLMQKRSSPPDVFDDVEPNSHGITRGEVEAAIVDWCRSHGDAPLCKKLRSE